MTRIRTLMAMTTAAAITGCGAGGAGRAPPPPPPPFARPAGEVPLGLTAADPYRQVLDAAFRERLRLRRDAPASLRVLSYWAPATTTGAEVQAWYARHVPPGWEPDPHSPLRFDASAPAGALVYAFAYRSGAHVLQVAGVERGPGAAPASGLLPIVVETDAPAAGEPARRP